MNPMIFILALTIAAVIGIGLGAGELVGPKGDAEPTSITCQALGESGPGANAHVRLTDWMTHPVQDMSFEDGNGRMTDIVFGVVARDDDYFDMWGAYVEEHGTVDGMPLPEEPVRVLVWCDWIRTERDRDAYVDAGKVQGLVSRGFRGGGFYGQARKDLEETFPGAMSGKYWVIHDGKKPGSAKHGAMWLAGGLLSALFAVLLAVRSRRELRGRKPDLEEPDELEVWSGKWDGS